MAPVTFTQRSQIGSGQLIASGPVGDCLDKLQTGTNTIDTAQISALAITTALLANLGVTTGKIADAAVTAAKIEAQQAWQALTLGGGATWSPTTIAYMKDSLGFVHFRGEDALITGGTVSPAATFATLPAGFRPGVTARFLLPNSTTPNATLIKIDTAGNLISQNGLTAIAYGFSSVCFRAEN